MVLDDVLAHDSRVVVEACAAADPSVLRDGVERYL